MKPSKGGKMKNLRESVRKELNELCTLAYHNSNEPGQLVRNIDRKLDAILAKFEDMVKGMKKEHNPENSLVEKYIIIGHNQVILDICKEMRL